MKIRKHKILFAAAFCLAVFFTGCSKDDEKDIIEVNNTLEDYEKVTSFLSEVTSIPLDQLKFDGNKMEYYVPNTDFKERYERVRSEYYASINKN